MNIQYIEIYVIQKLQPLKVQSQMDRQVQQEEPPKLRSKKSTKSHSVDDYQRIGVIGQGAYGRVILVKRNGKLSAMKQIQKKKLAKQKKEYQAFIEKELLMRIDHPGIVKLNKCFQDKRNLYFVLEYCEGGDLTKFINMNSQKITEQLRTFYIAEIIVLLQFLHRNKITHRDLKPENIMLSKNGHLKLIDFGTSQISSSTLISEKFKKQMEQLKKKNSELTGFQESSSEEEEGPRKRVATFVGTAYYISPQLLQFNICESPSDLWALGCIIYQLYYEKSPFKANTQFQVFQNIKNVDYRLPKNELISDEAVDLIKKLLEKDPSKRLGSCSKEGLMYEDLKAHPYFKDVNFQNIFNQQVPEIKEQLLKQQQIQEKREKLERTKTQILSQHLKLLEDNEDILIQGVVEKRTFVNYNFYYLAIFKNLSVIRIKSEEPEKKREMVIPKDRTYEQGPASLVSSEKFKLITSQKVYTFKSLQAQKWVEVINSHYLKQWVQK